MIINKYNSAKGNLSTRAGVSTGSISSDSSSSGGVSSLDDIKKIKVAEQDGIEGVIVGRSIYTGTLDLSEALKIANQ